MASGGAKQVRRSEAKKQVEIAQKHTNYEVSMMVEDLVGVIDLDYESEICHPTSGKLVGSYSLRHTLLDFMKMGGWPSSDRGGASDGYLQAHVSSHPQHP